MVNTVAQYEAYAKAHPTRSNGTPWADGANSWCVALVYSCGGFTGASFDDAAESCDYALTHNGGLDPDWSTAVPGEFDYWDTGAGHIAMRSQIHPGWDLMASNFVPAIDQLAEGMGYQTPGGYGIPTGHGHTYRGHSPYFRDQTLSGVIIPSGGGGTPVPSQPNESDDDMYYLRFTGSNPNEWLAIDDVHQQYRIIPVGGWEDLRLTAKVVAQTMVQENIDGATWQANFGGYAGIQSGASTGGITPAQLAAAVAPLATTAQVSTLPTLSQETTLAQQAVTAVAADITAAQTAILAKLPVAPIPTAAQNAAATVDLVGSLLNPPA